MERTEPNIDEVSKSKDEIQIKTESVQAGFLENGDTILLNDAEYVVVDINHQKNNGFIKVKDIYGNERQVYAYDHVKKLSLE